MTENLNQILKKLKSHYDFRGIFLSDYFEDFDKTNSGLVTESQVGSIMSFRVGQFVGSLLVSGLIAVFSGHFVRCHFPDHHFVNCRIVPSISAVVKYVSFCVM